MAYISQNTIRAIKQNVKITDVFEWLGAKVVRRGGGRDMAFCPFCADANSNNPGCSLNEVDGLFHCWVCSASGDLISAVIQHENVSFPEAVEMIAKQFNIPIEYEKSSDPESETKRKKMVSAMERTLSLFQEQRENKNFIEFLTSRNLSYDTALKFELGLSLYTKADEVVKTLQKEFDNETLINAGICYQTDDGRLVLRFKNRIIYPIRTAPGTLIGFGGRDITNKSKAKYINSPDTELFKKSNVLYGLNTAKRAISKQNEVIVCEGYMDTIALQTHGFENTVGVMGVALTTKNFYYLDHFVDKFYISLDGDEAGQNAAMRIAKEVPKHFSTDILVITIPRDVAKDPDEFFNQKKKTNIDWLHLMEQAQPLFLFCVKRMLAPYVDKLMDAMENDEKNNQLSSLRTEAKKKIGTFMAEHYDRMDSTQSKEIADYLIKSMGLIDSYSSLLYEWQQRNAGKNVSEKQEDFKELIGAFQSSATKDEDILIGTIYYHPETRDTVKKELDSITKIFTSPIRENIFDKICDSLSHGNSADEATHTFTQEETAELARILNDKNILDIKDNLSEGSIITVCNQLRKKNLEREIKRISESAVPDVMEIIKLKTQLAKMQQE